MLRRRSVQFDYSAQVEHFAQMMNRTAPATIGACCLPRHARHAVQQQAAAGAPRVCRGQLPCCSRAVPGRRPRGKTATSGKTSSEGLRIQKATRIWHSGNIAFTPLLCSAKDQCLARRWSGGRRHPTNIAGPRGDNVYTQEAGRVPVSLLLSLFLSLSWTG